jgi:hypothetical protein
VTRRWPSGSFSLNPVSTPIRRRRSTCSDRAASGHSAAAPPRSVMNSRRLIPTMGTSPLRSISAADGLTCHRTVISRPRAVAYAKSGSPLKADMCELASICPFSAKSGH